MSPGDEVQVKGTHGSPAFRFDIGTIEKLIPLNKAYVVLRDNGRQVVDLDDLQPVDAVSPSFLATAAIAQVARPEIVAWAETRRGWIEKRARDLIAMREFDKFHARSVLAGDIVRSFEAEASGKGRTK